MSRVLKSTVLVTVFTLAGQSINFVTQIIVAYLFGAGATIDAFNVAIILPQYINIAILGSLGFVLLPVFVEYFTSGRTEAAWHIASSIINISVIILGVICMIGIVFSDPILRVTAPGLSDSTRDLAVQLQIILWPSVLATGIAILLTGVYHSQSRFGWPAFVPILGSALGLLILLLTWKKLGVAGYAYGTTAGAFIQALLLTKVVFGTGRYRFVFNWHHPGIYQMFQAFVPLLWASMFGKATGLMERYLASSMPEGSISHLNYALRIVSVFAFFFSSGVGTVFFQRMAVDVSVGDLIAFRRTISAGIRFLWIVVAPVVAMTIVVSPQLVAVLFQHGLFSTDDTQAVSGLLQIYMLSLAPACIGNVTARAFYAAKDTRTVAILGMLESLAYILYTILLARFYGPAGIALGYVILFNGSLLWQALIIASRTGRIIGSTVLTSLLRTGIAAVLAGLAAWKAASYVSGAWLQICTAIALGLAVYVLVLLIFRPREFFELRSLLVGSLNKGIA